MESKLVCYLKWINTHSSAGSNQGHNRFSLKNKFALGILEMMTLFFQLDPPECVLLSPPVDASQQSVPRSVGEK